MPDPAAETVDYVAIQRLQAAYADVVNRRAWPELADLFRPDAPVRIDTVTRPVIDLTGPTAVGDFIGAAIERFDFFQFVILNAVVDLEGDRATGRIFMCELRRDRESGHGSRAFGRYEDTYVRHDGRWWFAARDYRSLARTGRDEVFPWV